MNRLTTEVIQRMVVAFVQRNVCTDDTTRQNIIDQLGTHPVNHAAFIKELMVITEGNWARYWEAYLHLAAAL